MLTASQARRSCARGGCRLAGSPRAVIEYRDQRGIRTTLGAAEEEDSMRMVVMAVALTVALACAAPARAAESIDAQHVTNDPGATLLLPYFEAQVPKKIGGKAPGITTLFSINNASATAILAHVTIWTDLAVPVTTFNVYLTGYDVQTIDMVDILNGKLPITASAGQDPAGHDQPTRARVAGHQLRELQPASCRIPP